MKLDEALKGQQALRADDAELLFYEGEILPDPDGRYVRLYADPSRRNTYLLFRREDIREEVYEWTKEELASAGYAGRRRWRIGVRMGADVQVIEIRVGKVGQLIGTLVGVSGSRGECKSGVSGCNPACCTVSSSGSGNCYCDYCCVGRSASSKTGCHE